MEDPARSAGLWHAEAGLEGSDAHPAQPRPQRTPPRAPSAATARPAPSARVRPIVTPPGAETPKSDSAERSEVEPGRGAAAGRRTAFSSASLDASPAHEAASDGKHNRPSLRGLAGGHFSQRSTNADHPSGGTMTLDTNDRILRIGTVLQLTGLSRSTLTGRSNAGSFRSRSSSRSAAPGGGTRRAAPGCATRCSISLLISAHKRQGHASKW